MSLDVYLSGPAKTRPCEHCDGTGRVDDTEECFSANITHNLTAMAHEAGIYKHLWRPEEIGVTHARQLIEPLRAGIALLESDPVRFKKHDPPNKWGSYEDFVPWVRRYLEACEEYPDAVVHASR